MKPIPRPIRRPVQQALRLMMGSKLSKPMALVIAANLRKREKTPLLRMVKDHKTTKAESLLAVTKGLRT